MNIETSFKKFNESLIGDIQRLNPDRLFSDESAMDLLDEIIEDFTENNEDFKKLLIINDGGNKISLDRIEIGKAYTLNYLFGKYHPVNNSLISSNTKSGRREIKISSVPFIFQLRRNKFHKFFKTARLKFGNVLVTDTKTIDNLSRNPNIGNHALYKEKVVEYNISSDVANKILTFFVKKFDIKYPNLKISKFKGIRNVNDIESGIQPVIKSAYFMTKDGKSVYYNVRLGDNINDVREKISNMTEKEYDDFFKKRNDELNKNHYEYIKRHKNELLDIIYKLLNNIKEIKEVEISSITPKYDFYLSVVANKDISDILRDIFTENPNIDDYVVNISTIEVSKGLSTKYITDDSFYHRISFKSDK